MMVQEVERMDGRVCSLHWQLAVELLQVTDHFPGRTDLSSLVEHERRLVHG